MSALFRHLSVKMQLGRVSQVPKETAEDISRYGESSMAEMMDIEIMVTVIMVLENIINENYGMANISHISKGTVKGPS